MKRFALSQWITIDRSIARSVNLERDSNNIQLLERYQITPVACETLVRLADALSGESVNAWSLTGPYGTGKSAFCNFMLAFMCGEDEKRALCYDKLSKADKKLAARFKTLASHSINKAYGQGVRAVSRYESLNSTLIRGLSLALKTMPNRGKGSGWKQLQEDVDRMLQKEWPSTREVVDAYASFAKLSKKPIFLVIDEFGKNLEFQAHQAEHGDIFALQALAESKSVYVWVCLHQAFSSYSKALSRVQREEWQKIQGRFEDRSYIEPPYRSFALIREALSIHVPDDAHKENLKEWAQAMKDSMSDVKINGLSELDQGSIMSLYPFHPLAIYLIGEMSRRFAQNDRTIFSFLSSGEPHAFASCLQRFESQDHKQLPTLGLDILYDYFSESNILRHADRSENQRWLEIHSIISLQSGTAPARLKLLKTIGVLNLLSGLPEIVASKDMIHAALATSLYKNKREIKSLLNELIQERILLFREYAGEYRLWEGSDFDLDREVLEARGRVVLRPLSETLEDIAPRPNLVAARHSFQSGTFREFVVRWCNEDDLHAITEKARAENDIDGTVWLMLGRQKISDNLLVNIAKKDSAVIIGYSQCLDQVSELILEAAATREACAAPQLERDGVARREARYRAAQAAQALKSFLEDSFSPKHGSVKWFADGEIKKISSQRQLSTLVSDLCDRIYRDCPRINNEMINVDRLSSMAVAARNKVAEALSNQYMSEDLGLTGFGPEVAVYRSVFKDTGLHRKTPEDVWILSAPDKKLQPQFAIVWDLFDRMLEEADRAGNNLQVREILDTLKRPPFGLREGAAPLLLIHYLLIHADEIAVYEENIFKPFFGDAEAILLMRRPELFSLRSYKSTSIRTEVIRTYYQVLNTELKLADRVRNQTLLSIVVPLTEFYKSLPEYTKMTRSIGANALRLRNAIAYARDPQQLLFHDIPEALGFSSIAFNSASPHNEIDATSLKRAIWASSKELRDAFDVFGEKVKGRFVLAMSDTPADPPPFEALCHDLKEKTAPLAQVCKDSDLKPVLAAMASDKGTSDEWFFQVAAIIMKKPVQSWQDSDIEPFIMQAEEISIRINQLHELKLRSGRKGRIDEASRFMSVLLPDGSIFSKTFQIQSKHGAKTKEMSKQFEKVDTDTRSALLASLIKIMEEKGDFK